MSGFFLKIYNQGNSSVVNNMKYNLFTIFPLSGPFAEFFFFFSSPGHKPRWASVVCLSVFQPMRTHYGPWQPCWISNQHQKQKSGRGPSNEHFWQVWLKLSFADRKFKMATMTRLSLTLGPMGISHFHLFFGNHKTDLNQTWQKCSLDGHIQDLCFWCWSEIQHGCQGL
jgi:hypothetical protein